MSRGILEYILKMSTVQLNVACKVVVDDACRFLLGGCLNLLSDGCFQCSKWFEDCPGRCGSLGASQRKKSDAFRSGK